MELELIILFFAAIPIGIFGVVVGGNATLSFPTFQVLFPEMTLGAIVGNIKPGSVVRNIMSLIPLRHDIDFAAVRFLLVPLLLGSVAGALLVADMSQSIILPVLILGFLVVEYARRLEKYITKHIHFLMTFLTGMYGGVFGAGISLLIVALMHIKDGDDENLYKTRANALFLETFFTTVAVMVFVSYGLVVPHIMLTWLGGSLIGGYLGGIILKKTGKLSGHTQRTILRGAFIFAICVAMVKVLS